MIRKLLSNPGLLKVDQDLRIKFRRWLSKRGLPTKEIIRYTDFDVYSRHTIVVDALFGNGSELPTRILDVGGRVNSLVPFLPTSAKNYKIFALNLEFKDLVNAQSTVTIPVQGDGAKLPFLDNTFDIVMSITTLEHIPREHLGVLRLV